MTSSWMLVAGFLFAAAGVFVKLGSTDFSAAELTFYRSFFTVVLAIGFVRARGGTLRTRHMGAHLMRGIMGAVSLLGFYYAITKLPLATAQTLNYTSPIFLAIATTVVLRERFSGLLLAAVVLGFAGVAMLLQPNFAEGTEGPAVIGLFSGVLAAWAYLSVRTLGRLGEPDFRVVFWFGVTGSVFAAAWQLASGGFNPVRWHNAWVLAGLGVAGFLAQMALTRAYRTGNTLVVGAYSYSAVLFATVATIAIWDERLGALEWGGMLVIIASGILAMRAERRERLEEGGFDN